MFERFAEQARYAIVVAQEQARELGAAKIDVEYLLLGLTACPDEALRDVLSAHGVTTDGVREVLRGRVSERGSGVGDVAEDSGEPLGEQDAAALRSIGIDLDAVRDSLEATFGEDALDRAVPAEQPPRRGRFRLGASMNFGHIPFTKESKKALELSLREALSRGDGRIEAGHVLLGLLRTSNDVTGELLGGAAGTDRLRRAVRELLDRAA